MRYSRRDRPGTVRQPDLFAAPASRSPGSVPVWEALPAQARTDLTALMIRLILEHARSRRATAIEGARHEP
jgi:hypothetical protein